MNFGELDISSIFTTKSELPEVFPGIQFQNEDMSFQGTCFKLLVINVALISVSFNVIHF
jgi:hypothetical protein